MENQTPPMQRRTNLLRELVRDHHYAVDPTAVANAILTRAALRGAVAGTAFRNDLRAAGELGNVDTVGEGDTIGPPVRSFRPSRQARSFRPCHGKRSHPDRDPTLLPVARVRAA
jgi:hypothetical protein